MRLSIFASFALFATFAVAGCAVDPTDQTEETGDSQQAAGITDKRLENAVQSDNDYVVNRNPQAVENDQSRLYNFSQVPRIGERAPFEVNVQETLRNVAIPHSSNANVAGRVGNGVNTKCGAGGC